MGFINDNPSITNLNISGVFTSWESGAPLSVTITADGGFGDGSLELSSSTFTLDYDNGEAPAPVPEPASLLLGSGLIGLAGLRRKKSRS